jgi:ATP-dependent protease HslVU (ClpYQ) ATPase subunit
MDEISFQAPEMTKDAEVTITKDLVKQKVGELLQKGDMKKYVL